MLSNTTVSINNCADNYATGINTLLFKGDSLGTFGHHFKHASLFWIYKPFAYQGRLSNEKKGSRASGSSKFTHRHTDKWTTEKQLV